MSLQVWLPLDGNLKNQGLTTNISVVNNGATINTNGKIGKCYCFENDSSYITISKEAMNNFSDKASVCFWLKILNWNKEWATFFQAGTNGTGWENYIFGFSRDGKTDKCCFTISHGSTSNGNNYKTPSLLQNEWYHIALTYRTGNCLMYINGELYQPYSTSIVPNFSGIINIVLGKCTDGTNYQTNCLINDFRIYNHCLSEQEIKKISQGLILHYPLNNNGRGKPNLVPTDLTKWVKESGVTCTRESPGNMYKLNDSSHSSSRWGIYYDITLQANKTYTFSVTGFKVSHTVGFGFAQTSGFPTAGPEFTSTKTRKSITITIGSSNANCRIYLYLYPSSGGSNLAYFGLPKLEEGAVETAYNFNVNDSQYTSFNLNDNMQADISGYGRNGIKNNITYDTNTPKYNLSSVFNGTDSYIKVNDANWMIQGIEEFTFTYWVRDGNSGRMISCTQGGGFASGNGEICFHVFTNSAQTSSNWLTTGFNINGLSSGWHMITVVYNQNQGYKIYIDGNLNNTVNYTSSYGLHWNTSARLFLGCQPNVASPSAPYFSGKISDFRMYTTALSAEDIKELYQYNNL